MVDKITPNTTIAKIRRQAVETSADPFIVGLTGGKTITFCDIMSLEAEKSFEVTKQLSGRADDVDPFGLFRLWLSDTDFKKLKAEKLTLGEMVTLMEMVTTHFEDTFEPVDLGKQDS